jgi:hypothetical protein
VTAPSRQDLAAGATLALLAAVLWAGLTEQAFTNTDDWFHLDVALGLIDGDADAWRMVFSGGTSSGDLRAVPFAVWILDWWVHGLWAGGYYLTNGLLLGVSAMALYAVVRRRSDVWAAWAAAAVFLFEPVRAEPLVFLSAREDGVAVALVAATLVLWPRLRTSNRGVGIAALLYVLACSSKAPALVLPGMLAALDRADGVRDRRWAWLLIVTAAWGVWAGFMGLGSGLSAGSSWAEPALIVRRLVPAVAPWPVLLVLVLWRKGSPTSVRLGLELTGWGLLVAAPWLLRGDGDVHGRYLLLAGLGNGVLAAGLMPEQGRLRPLAAVALVGGAVVLFLASPPGGLVVREQSSARMIDALETAPAGAIVSTSFPHGGIEGLLSSPVRGQLLGGRDDLRAVLQGQPMTRTADVPRYSYTHWADAGVLQPGDTLLAEGQGGAWQPWVIPAPAASSADLLEWRFDRSAHGWGGAWRDGLVVPVEPFPLHMLPQAQADRLAARATLSPPVSLSARDYCRMELSWTERDLPGGPPSGDTLLDAGAVLILRWSAPGEELARRSVVVPLKGTSAAVALWTVPDWVAAPGIQQLSLMPLGFGGELEVTNVRLVPCGGL